MSAKLSPWERIQAHYSRAEEELARGSGTAGLSVALIRSSAQFGRELAGSVRRVLGSYDGPSAFQKDWKWARLLVPLQLRLLVEQVLWDKGEGWRKLITGFGPIRSKRSRPPAKRF